MLEYNNQYETHPLYNHFKSWIDMEENYQDSYFIINTALYAAENYIYTTYGISTRATLVREYFGDITDTALYPKFNISNLLAIYTDEGYVLPSITYYDNTTGVYLISDGPFILGDSVLDSTTATNLNVEYVTGYVYPTNARDTATIPEANEEWGSDVSTPSITNPDGSPLYSPLSTTNEFYDLYIVGDEGASIYINDVIGELKDASGALITQEVNPREVINSDRIGKVTLTLVDGINTFNVTAQDGAGNISKTMTIVINKQVMFNDVRVNLYSKDLVTNNGQYKLVLETTPGSTININGVDETMYSTGIDVIEAEHVIEELFSVAITVTSPTGVVSRTLITNILYDSTLTDEYVEGINDVGNNSMTMPQDMLMALLMIAHHYFRIALYKHEDTNSYGDSVSNRTTFIADRFPKEAHRILSRYTSY